MLNPIRITRHNRPSTILRCFSSTRRLCRNVPPSVPRIQQSLNLIDLDEFRTNAFIPEQPVLISNGHKKGPSLPAEVKWFTHRCESGGDGQGVTESYINAEYFSAFDETILPYEFYSCGSRQKDEQQLLQVESGVLSFLHEITQSSPSATFHRFYGPLSLFLSALNLPRAHQPKLYIAQAQISDLPKSLRDDLPTPLLVRKVGKGDVYDANLWIGIPPTYTPLHKDPNPNIFFQLASRKRVRLLSPAAGLDTFRIVQEKIRQNASGTFRGNEMMEGPEREELEQAVWGENNNFNGYEVQAEAGDALFIPKGWWHSIKSEGEHVNASVNWWFR